MKYLILLHYHLLLIKKLHKKLHRIFYSKFIMPKTKEQCPECCTYTLTIKSQNCNTIYDEQNRLHKNKLPKSKRTVEAVLNKIISEWKLWSEHQK